MATKTINVCDVVTCGKEAEILTFITVDGKEYGVCPKCAAKFASFFQPKTA